MKTAADRLTRLESELEAIHQQIAAVRAEGEVIQGKRLDLVAPGGTAGAPSQQRAKYARLRWGRGAEQQSEYVPLTEIPHTAAAVARGKVITQLERKATRIQKQIAAVEGKV
jgi:hypothetical protein